MPSPSPPRRPRLVFLIHGLLLAGAATVILASGLRTDNGVDRFMVQDDVTYERFQHFRRLFGSGDYLICAVRLSGDPGEDLLQRTKTVSGAFQRADEDLQRRTSADRPFFTQIVGPHDFPQVREALAQGRAREVFTLPFIGPLHFSASPSGDYAYVVGELRPEIESGVLGDLLDRIEDGLPTRPDPESGIMLAGSPVLNVALDRASREQAKRLFPFLAVIGFLVLAWLTGSWRAPLAVGVVAVFAITAALSALVATGCTLNMMTTALPAVLLVLATAPCLHVYRAFGLETSRGMGPAEAARAAVAQVGRPCTVAALTTAVGFVTLCTSRVGPIREMGAFSAVGILAGLLASLTLLPALLAGGWIPTRARRHRHLPRLLRPLRPGLLLGGTIVVVIGLSLGIPRVRIESGAIRFLPASHPVVRTFETLRTSGRGLSSVELLATLPPPPPKALPGLLEEMRLLDRRLEEIPEVRACTSPADLFDLLGPAALLNLRHAQARRFIRRDPGTWTVRLHLSTTPVEVQAMKVLVRKIESVCSRFQREHPSLKATVTGLAPIMIGLQGQLIESQIKSLLLAFLLVGVIMLVSLRSLRLSLLGAVPNIVPLLLIYGFLGWAGIKLDVATVTVGSIALGIAVDDTVHVLSAWRTGDSRRRAALRALHRVWWPVLSTSIFAAAGFSVLSISEFAPMQRFGVITSVVMLLAVVGDLFILPALLVLFGPAGERRSG